MGLPEAHPYSTRWEWVQCQAIEGSTQGFKGVLYIAPIQMELDTTALPPESESFNDMQKEKCQKCGITYPLVILTAHIKSCVTTDEAEQSNDEAEQTSDEAEQSNDEAEQTKQVDILK